MKKIKAEKGEVIFGQRPQWNEERRALWIWGGVLCRSQPVKQWCGWIGPRGSYYDCKAPFSNSHWETLKKQKFFTYRTWKSHSTWGHTARSWGEREKACVSLGFCFYWGQGWGPRFLRAHSLLVNLKHKDRNLKHGKRKNKLPKQLSNSTNIAKTKEPQCREAAWLFI